jgi:hypothetical protein
MSGGSRFQSLTVLGKNDIFRKNNQKEQRPQTTETPKYNQWNAKITISM